MAIGDIIVGVDIGTSKVSTVIGQVNLYNQVDVLGSGTSNCNGVKKGIIVEVEATAKAIKHSVVQAERIANVKVKSAYVNITGGNVSVTNSKGSIDISENINGVSYSDIEKVFYQAKDVEFAQDKKLIDIIPYQYIIDNYDQIIDPIGMKGSNFEVDCQIIAGSVTSVQNIISAFDKAGLDIDGLVLEAVADSEVVLKRDEKDLGVLLIDIGATISDISIFKGKRLVYYNSIHIGGDHITNDIAIGLKLPYNEADKIKKKYSIALVSLIDNDQKITITSINENKHRSINISEVIEIIEARVHEMFTLIKEELEQAGIEEQILAGAVLTGRGIAGFDGIIEISSEILGLPIRVEGTKRAKGTNISKTSCAVALGIVKYISQIKHIKNIASKVKGSKKIKSVKKDSKLELWIEKIKKFFYDLF